MRRDVIMSNNEIDELKAGGSTHISSSSCGSLGCASPWYVLLVCISVCVCLCMLMYMYLLHVRVLVSFSGDFLLLAWPHQRVHIAHIARCGTLCGKKLKRTSTEARINKTRTAQEQQINSMHHVNAPVCLFRSVSCICCACCGLLEFLVLSYRSLRCVVRPSHRCCVVENSLESCQYFSRFHEMRKSFIPDLDDSTTTHDVSAQVLRRRIPNGL